jgi:addiction module RelE/StbE family toxin
LRIKWLKRALLDLDEAESYIARDNPSVAAEVVLKIAKAVSLLGQQPGLGRPGRVSGTRELVVPDTPYIVPYRVKENTVQVLRVYHSSRKWPYEIP